MRETEQKGKDVQAAIEAGLAQLRLRRDQVEVVIKEKGSSGFFGIGSKPAVVVIREKRWDNNRGGGSRRDGQRGGRGEGRSSGGRGGRGEGRSSGGRGGNRFERRPPRQRREKEFTNYERPEKVQCPSEAYEEVTPLENQQPLPKQELQAVPETSAQVAADSRAALEQILNLLGVKAENMESGWDPVQERLVLRFDSDSPALLIGKDGQTIEALQYVVTLMAARKHDIGFAIQVETGSYWTRIESRLNSQIARGVDMVKSTSRSFRMAPMSSMQRRFVHRVLSNHPDVETCSEGEGKWRKVVVRPRKTPLEAAKPAQERQPVQEQPAQEQAAQEPQQQPQESTPVEAAKGE